MLFNLVSNLSRLPVPYDADVRHIQPFRHQCQGGDLIFSHCRRRPLKAWLHQVCKDYGLFSSDVIKIAQACYDCGVFTRTARTGRSVWHHCLSTDYYCS